jgi:FdhD protein
VATRELLAQLPGRRRAALRVFESTSGLHAAGLFADGALRVAREDVGRHNAVDKVLGATLLAGGVPAPGGPDGVRPCLIRAGAEGRHGRGAGAGRRVGSSSLAVELAAEAGRTLVGFLRGESMNVYTGAHRLTERVALMPLSGDPVG